MTSGEFALNGRDTRRGTSNATVYRLKRAKCTVHDNLKARSAQHGKQSRLVSMSRRPCTSRPRRSMRILFDHGTPALLIPFLEGHVVTKAKQAGWDRLVNGELLSAAEATDFEPLVTPDKNMRY